MFVLNHFHGVGVYVSVCGREGEEVGQTLGDCSEQCTCGVGVQVRTRVWFCFLMDTMGR